MKRKLKENKTLISPELNMKDKKHVSILKVKNKKKDSDDEKFETEDEIPIKTIIEKEKQDKLADILKQKSINDSETDLKAENINDKSPIVDTKSTEEFQAVQNKNEEIPAKVVENILLSPIIHKANHQSKSSRKRKTFTLSKFYKDVSPVRSNSKSRVCDSSSDEHSSSSRNTLDLIIPPPENFLGSNNPFRNITPPAKRLQQSRQSEFGNSSAAAQKQISFSQFVKQNRVTNSSSISKKLFNSSSVLDFSALKNNVIYHNISNSDLAKAAGQPRLVRTIKRRLSAKDITIGPNQEVRRRRTRRLSSAIEIIRETPLNTYNIFPIHAKDLAASSSHNAAPSSSSIITNKLSFLTSVNNTSSESTSPQASSSSLDSASGPLPTHTIPLHGRTLRQRPDRILPNNIRRHSICLSPSSTIVKSTFVKNSNAREAAGDVKNTISIALGASSRGGVVGSSSLNELQQSVNKYFGTVNRFEQGEPYTVVGKRKLVNGKVEYLVEWG